MKIYGYLTKYFDYTDEQTHSDYGFVPACNAAEATAKVEEIFDADPFGMLEVTVQNLMEDEDCELLDRYQINFFIDAAKQNGYGED